MHNTRDKQYLYVLKKIKQFYKSQTFSEEFYEFLKNILYEGKAPTEYWEQLGEEQKEQALEQNIILAQLIHKAYEGDQNAAKFLVDIIQIYLKKDSKFWPILLKGYLLFCLRETILSEPRIYGFNFAEQAEIIELTPFSNMPFLLKRSQGRPKKTNLHLMIYDTVLKHLQGGATREQAINISAEAFGKGFELVEKVYDSLSRSHKTEDHQYQYPFYQLP